jgi:dihydrofolate reductase
MARKVIIYIASSINNKIAARDGSVAWLESIPHKEGEDYGYYKFYETIDTTIMGYATYAQLKSWDIPFPYPDKKNFVITRKKDPEADSNVEFIIKDHIQFVSEIKNSEGKDIWLIGGGQVNTLLLNAGLVDEIIVHVMPVILDGGLDMFAGIPGMKALALFESKAYDSGVVELRYLVINK